MSCSFCLEELLRQGHLLINICMSGKFPQGVRDAALVRFRGNVVGLHGLKFGRYAK